MKIKASRRIQFCAGHRVYRHESKCRNLHGHNYVLRAFAEAETLDPLGRVIDFSVLKDRVGSWLKENWDHGFIVMRDDLEARKALDCIEDQKLFVMDCNPTAENMAEFVLRVVGPKVLSGTAVRLVEVELWETENCHVVAKL